MAPRNGNSIVKHGVLDERLNVHGVQGLKVADLSICPDNVGCNTCKFFVLRNPLQKAGLMNY
jgi:alcohol oxidase